MVAVKDELVAALSSAAFTHLMPHRAEVLASADDPAVVRLSIDLSGCCWHFDGLSLDFD